MSNEQLTVSDFDGTITDITSVGQNFAQRYGERVADHIGQKRSEYLDLLSIAIKTVTDNPQNYGWIKNGFDVSPPADPLLLGTVANKVVLSNLEKPISEKLSGQIYFEIYPTLTFPFRADAKEFVEELSSQGTLVFVTNSQKNHVESSLRDLIGSEVIPPVFGEAKKYDIFPDWGEVAETGQPEGSPRTVLLRRKSYAEIIKKIQAEWGVISTVVGDIYELDLALPETMGIRTGLLLSELTPIWEAEHYANHTNGFSAVSLKELGEKIVSF